MSDEYKHDDFEVVRIDERYGTFEELKLKNKNATPIRFFRKSLAPGNLTEIDDLNALQELVLKEGCSGVTYPMYTHNERRWALMSVPDKYYGTTGLAA
ncbi:hypothetical protein BJV74DRAFT_887802 [Russula compacta]|nr:hypothetical protein BJV74DRAFT_887802 [Russula compacta]